MPVLCDVAPGSWEMDYDRLGDLITERTKAIIPVDLGGRMCDYDRIFAAAEQASERWTPANNLQRCFDRPIVIADAAHSLGATRHGKPAGSVADFSTFSFHAVKNFTTAEGGALAWREHGFDNDAFYRQIMLLSLHGQTKDALAKDKAGAWEYDIEFPGWKCNMTDLQAALGLAQLERYPDLLARRRVLIERYAEGLMDVEGMPLELLRHFDDDGESSGHLMAVRMIGRDAAFRNEVIDRMAKRGVSTNVHYKPLPLLSAYRNLGFDIEDFPNAYAQFENEITLPLHTLLTDEDVDYVIDAFKDAYAQASEEGDR